MHVINVTTSNSPVSPQTELRGGQSAEDVPVTSRMGRPVGKVTQAFPDGTLLLELTRPPNEPFGFLISRGKGRADTGRLTLLVFWFCSMFKQPHLAQSQAD